MSRGLARHSMEAADELGDERLGPEHFLIALLRIEGHARTALNACCVTDASLLAEVRRGGPKANKPPPPMPMSWRLENRGASQTMARAHGLAVGLGVALPKASPPKRRSWEAPVRVSRDEFERRTAELRAAGILYGFNYQGEEVLLLVERPADSEE